MRKFEWRLAPLLPLVLACLPSCRGDAPRVSLRDVVLITVDTLRPDHMGIYGYGRGTTPHLERWFADAARFERAYSTSASTPPSIVSLLTGRLPHEHGVRLFWQLVPEDLRILADELPDAYQTAAFVSNFVLTDEALGLADHFDHYDDFVDERESRRKIYERNGRRTTRAALAWLRGERDPKRPLFLWVHYIDPHALYRPPDEWPRTFRHEGFAPIEPNRLRLFQRDPEVRDGLDYIDLYDEEIRYVDRAVGELLEGYADLVALTDTLVVFTADHGETLMERERWFQHRYHVYEELIRVPLLIRGPGVVPGVRREPVSGIDVAPTILRFAGVETGGVDLALPGGAPGERTLFVEATFAPWHWRAAVRGEKKWMIRLPYGGEQVEERRYYDLASDPEERRPRDWNNDAQVGQQLTRLIEADPAAGGLPENLRRGVNTMAPKFAPRASARDLEGLRALGYVE